MEAYEQLQELKASRPLQETEIRVKMIVLQWATNVIVTTWSVYACFDSMFDLNSGSSEDCSNRILGDLAGPTAGRTHTMPETAFVKTTAEFLSYGDQCGMRCSNNQIDSGPY